MIVKFVNYWILLGSALLSWSCLSEKISGCEVDIAVHDKNYDNAAEVGDIVRDETLPMISYIGSLVTGSRPAGGGNYTYSDESLSPVQVVHPLDLSRFVSGDYEITSIGGGNAATVLHPDGGEGVDLWLGYDKITFPPSIHRTIWLYRTKGKLIVEPENIPAGIGTLGVEIDGVYARADGGAGTAIPIVYGGSASVVKQFDVATAGAATRFETLLAPSVEAVSPLRIVFTSVDGISETISLNVSILRNHITVVRPRYDPQSRQWDITVMIDGKWVKVDNLNIA
jgi:hypothetical protein